VGILAEVMFSTQDFFSNYAASTLMAPVFQPTPESSTLFLQQFRANKWAGAGARIVWTIWKQLDLRVEGYTFHPYQRFRQNPDLSTAYKPIQWDPRFMGMGGLVYNSPVGPISLMVNYHDKEQTPWSVLFHIGYILFNNRALE
jgi:NTE family protein